MPFSRRNLLIGSGIAAIGGGVWFAARKALEYAKTLEALRERKAEVQRFFREFPTDIPGAAKVEKFPVEDAMHCFVHLRHIHRWDHLLEETHKRILEPLDEERKKRYKAFIESEEIKEGIESALAQDNEELVEVEGDLRQILTYLTEHCGIEELYCEGVTEKRQAEYEQFQETWEKGKQLSDTLNELLAAQSSHLSEQQKQAVNDVQQKETKTLQTIRRALGGATDLFLNGKLHIRAADTSEKLDATIDSLFSNSTATALKQEEREDTLLQTVSDTRRPFAIVRYGADHQWWDNITRWNAEHPDDMFCLIEVTPTAVKKYGEKYGEKEK